MSLLTFDEESHQYHLDGERLPSVSEIKGPLVDLSGVAPAVLAKASQFGRAVHKMAELYFSNDLDYGSLDEGLFGTLLALERWLEEVRPFEDVDGKGALIDIKSRKFDRVADPVQLAAYHQLYLENDIKEVTIERPLASAKHRFAGTPDIIIPPKDGGLITNHRILYLGRDGKYTYTPAYERNAWPIFAHLLADYWRPQLTEQILNSWRNRI